VRFRFEKPVLFEEIVDFPAVKKMGNRLKKDNPKNFRKTQNPFWDVYW
jgi:hypothetical protein